MDKIEDNEVPELSSAALEALEQFYADRDAHQQHFENTTAEIQNASKEIRHLTMDAFTENWNDSQFWYSEQTATLFARELLRHTDDTTVIAVISAPSVFIQLKNCLAASGKAANQRPKIHLLEFDRRFSVFPEFIFYDFQSPLELPRFLKGSTDRIICDPPFLSDDCQTKVAITVNWLSKASDQVEATAVKSSSLSIKSHSKLIICTGERMRDLVMRLYRPQGVAVTTFQPIHARGLSNEFHCYASFECEDWKWDGKILNTR